MHCNQKILWHIIAILLSVAGSIILFTDRFIIEEEVRKEVSLKNVSEYLEEWSQKPVNITSKFWFFDILNGDFIEDGSESSLHVTQVGPFVFDRRMKREILSMNYSTIEYEPNSVYTYHQDWRRFALKSEIETVNVPLAAVMSRARATGSSLAIRSIAALAAMTHSRVFVTKTVRELLFEGYVDKLLRDLKLIAELAHILDLQDISEEFSFMKQKNESGSEGNWTVLRGVESPDETLQLVRWNGESELKYFPTGSKCNELKGNDGSKFRPGVQESDVLFLFLVSDFCAAIPFTFDSYSYVGDIQTMRFKFRFSDTTNMPCMSPDGIIDVSSCHMKAPIFLSAPHFLHASPSLSKHITGLQPNESLHESYFDVDPITGLLLRISLRIQVNAKITKDMAFAATRNLTFDEMIIPIFWTEQTAEASADQLELLRERVYEKMHDLEYISWSLIALGTTILICMHAFIYLHKIWKAKKAEHLIQEETE